MNFGIARGAICLVETTFEARSRSLGTQIDNRGYVIFAEARRRPETWYGPARRQSPRRLATASRPA